LMQAHVCNPAIILSRTRAPIILQADFNLFALILPYLRLESVTEKHYKKL